MNNTNISVKCANPTIIINPKVKSQFYNLRYIHNFDTHYLNRYTDIDTFIKHLSFIRHSVNYDNINDYYCVTHDGEIINTFILVACRHCFICKDNYSKQWQFRCIAESNISKNQTYMVTLTYNNEFLPSNGINIRAVQLFMKRLRNNLDKLNIEHSLKYLAVGEYGSKTQRPHYHLILWHFPDDKFKNITEVLHFIEHSWSVYDFETQQHTPIGFAYCKPINKNSVRYCLKYCFKKRKEPKGKNPNFMLSSKFIGYQYLIDNYSYFKNNPQLISVSIVDKLNGDIHTSPYPEYFRYNLSKHTSQIFPKEIIDLFKHCLILHTKLLTLNDIEPFNYTTSQVLYNYYNILYDAPKLFTHPLNDNYIDSYYNIYYNTFYNQHLNDTIINLNEKLNQYLILLDSYYKKNISIYNTSSKFNTSRLDALTHLPNRNYKLTEIQAINAKYEYRLNKYSHKEVF